MKHDWEPVHKNVQDVCNRGWDPERKCKNCGAVQTREDQTLWMRIVGYRWLPLVGRCKGSRIFREKKK